MKISSSFTVNNSNVGSGLAILEGKEVRKTEFDRDSSQTRNKSLSAMDQAILAHRILCANKTFSSVRVKRAVSEGAAAESPRTTGNSSPQLPPGYANWQELKRSLPEIKRADMLNIWDPVLNDMRPALPIVSRLLTGTPNPPPPPGCDSWEAFLSSTCNSIVKNPKQEVSDFLLENGIIFRKFTALDQENISRSIYNTFWSNVGWMTPRELEARHKVYNRDITKVYTNACFKIRLIAENIKRQMNQKLLAIRPGESHRWAFEGVAHSPHKAAEWYNIHLPKALQAVADVDISYYLDKTEFAAVRKKWEDEGNEAVWQRTQRNR